jgi:hypothetical protein
MYTYLYDIQELDTVVEKKEIKDSGEKRMTRKTTQESAPSTPKK